MFEGSNLWISNIGLSNSRSFVMSTKDFLLLLKVLFLVLALALFSAACGSSEPKDGEISIPLPGGNSISMDETGGEMNIEGEDGSFHMKADTEGVEYPAELEDEFPVCPGCTPVQVMNISDSISVMLKVEGSMDDAHNFYVEKAKAAGYKEAMNNQMEDLRMFLAQKDGKTFTCNSVVEEDGEVYVNLRIM